MHLVVKLSEEQLPQIKQPNVHISALYDLVYQLLPKRLLFLVVARHLLEHLWLPAPILQHLRRCLDEIASDGCSMEPGELGPRKESMEDVAHFVEEGYNVVVTHESWLIGSWLGKIGDHCSCWVATLPFSSLVAWENRPDCGV